MPNNQNNDYYKSTSMKYKTWKKRKILHALHGGWKLKGYTKNLKRVNKYSKQAKKAQLVEHVHCLFMILRECFS